MGNCCDYPYSVTLIMCTRILYTFMASLTALSVA